ncbi:hypothetical protein FOCG_18322 [Fusarium oxysporum f. sp. radicis-lycopersici 26381]|nr:hypothetical protein FOCG_18322 [Fusarium oxysporum f. sp. radicis-lycopersici 26381]
MADTSEPDQHPERVKNDQGEAYYPMSPDSTGYPTDVPSPIKSQHVLNPQVATAPQPQPRPLRPLPAVPDALPERSQLQDSKKRGEAAVGGPVVSPFTANEYRLIVTAVPHYSRLENGQVNEYVKFRRPPRGSSRRPPGYVTLPSEDNLEEITPNPLDRRSNIITLVGPLPASAISPAPNGTISPMSIEGGWTSASSPVLMTDSPVSPQDTSLTLTTRTPRMLPPQFGFQAKMDKIARQLF